MENFQQKEMDIPKGEKIILLILLEKSLNGFYSGRKKLHFPPGMSHDTYKQGGRGHASPCSGDTGL